MPEITLEIRNIKKTCSNKAIIICGGPHAAALPESLLKLGSDIVFVGEAEESLPAFLNHFHQTHRLPDDKIILPLPLKSFDEYPPFSVKRKFFGPIELRRGCTNSCVFCQTPGLFKKVRERSINLVKKYVQYMKEHKRQRIIFTIPDVLSYGLNGTRLILITWKHS